MKIGYLVYNLDVGAGWGRYARELIDEVRKEHEVVIVKELPDTYDNSPVLLKTGWKTFFVNWPRLLWVFRNCDIIHALDLYPYGFIGYFLAVILRKKFIISGVGTYSVAPLHSSLGWFARLVCSRADCIISISHYTDSEIAKAAVLRRHEVITPGIELSKYDGISRQDVSSKYIITVGALKRRKGQDISLRAFALAHKAMPNLKYYIVGSQRDIGYFNELKKIVIDNELEKSVHFLQNVPDSELSQLYANAELFIMLSRNEGHHYEGFGLVFLEASAFGLPVVGTTGNGIADAVNQGMNGFLVPQNDPIKASEAIIKILETQEIRDNMSRESFAWAKANTAEKSGKRYIKIYEEIL